MVVPEVLSSYRGKKIFLTGHTGFKGAWLLSCLHLLGAEIRGYALESDNTQNLFNCIDGEKMCDSVIADIRSGETLKAAVVEFQPDYIFHLAAQPLVRRSYEIPVETFDVNVIGTANLLESVRALKKPCSVVIVTTDKVYSNNEWHYPYREIDNLGGYDPYSASKACSELVVDSYRNSFFNVNDWTTHGKAIASARAGNVIGGGDWSIDRIVPDIVKALQLNESILIRSPNSIRPWQHVLEPLLGYLILGVKLSKNPRQYSGPYNLGPYEADTLSVEELVKTAIGVWGSGVYDKHNHDPQNSPHEAGILKLDISKAVKELEWKPKLSSAEAVAWSMEWYRKPSIDLKRKYTFEQISNYFTL